MAKKMKLKLRNILSATMRNHVAKVRKTGSKRMTSATKKTLRAVMKIHNSR